MFCAKCQKDVTDCTCPDIEERLESLYQNPHIRPAAAMNILARKARQAELKTEEIVAENKRLREENTMLKVCNAELKQYVERIETVCDYTMGGNSNT